MRKLRLAGIIVFAAWGGHTLYKYLSEEGKVFVSDTLLPEIKEIVSSVTNVPVEVTQSSMDEYFEAHKNDIIQIINDSLTDETHADVVAESVKEIIKDKVEEAKPDFETVLAETIKDVDIYKKSVHKPIKHKKFKYCVKIEHKNYTPNELIIRQLRND